LPARSLAQVLEKFRVNFLAQILGMSHILPGLVVFLLAIVPHRPAVVGWSKPRIDHQILVTIRDGAVMLAFVEIGKPPVAVSVQEPWGYLQGLGVVRDGLVVLFFAGIGPTPVVVRVYYCTGLLCPNGVPILASHGVKPLSAVFLH
jgi:hypothetical protein